MSIDIFTVFKPLWEQLWWLLPLLVLAAWLQSPRCKGWLGEWLIKTKAHRKLPANIYQALHDVTLPDGAGTTQIDHIFVSPYGLFVLETKNYKGWIFGTARDAQWTQTTGCYKHRFQNPLRQNHRHTACLTALLGIHHDLVHSVVVFTGNARFKTPMPANVCTLGNFDQYIRSFRTVVLTGQEIQTICQAIASARLAPGRATNATHRQNLRKRHVAPRRHRS